MSSNSKVNKKPKGQKTNHPGLGGEYELLLPAYLALRFFKNKEIKDFRLRSNVEGFGKFDDIVIDIELENDSKYHFALQLKHKESKDFKLRPRNFYNEKDFNLEKYCAEYTEKLNEYHCIIYTNANFNPNEIEKVENFKMSLCENGFAKVCLDTSGSNENAYKFEINENTTKEYDFDLFLQHFSLFVAQKNSEDLEEQIKNIFKIEYATKDDKISTEYINLFRKWHKRQFTNFTIDRKVLCIHLVDLLLGNFIMETSKETIKRDKKLRLLEESIRTFDVTVIEDLELKLVKELGKYEAENCLPSYIQEILDQYAKDFNRDKEPLILRLAKEYKFVDKWTKYLDSDKELKIFNYLLGKPLIINYSENFKHQISKVLEINLKKNVHIIFVLVGKEIDLKLFNDLKKFNTLQDLCISNNNLYQEVINEIDISLQGRQKIKLGKIIASHEELPKTIQVKYLFQENLMFGKPSEQLPQYYEYIPRTVSVALLDENKILNYFLKKNYCFTEKDKDHILVIDYVAEEKYVKNFAQRNSLEIINVEEFINKGENINTSHKYIIVTNQEVFVKQKFDQICSMTDDNVHFLKINKPGEFILIKSKNNIIDDINEMCIKETEIPSYFSKGIHVLCAEPGMGKTTTMKTIRNNCSSDYWTIFVELKQYDFLFKKYDLKSDEILEYFLNNFNEDPMDKEIGNIFLKKRKVALFLDGLDEVNYQRIDNVLRLVKKLKEEGFHVWVSSRNNLREKIETELNQFSINISEINEEQQRHYITNRLRRDDKYSQDEIDKIITSIFNSVDIKNNSNILGIPLQLFMVTQVFINDEEDNLELNDKLFVLTKLYASYFEGKVKHALLKGGLTDKYYIGDITKNKLKQYQILGLRSSLNDEDWEKLGLHKKLEKKKDFLEEIEKKGDTYGIINNINQNKTVIFVHHTHAEYFAATYLSKNFDKVRILGECFLTEKYDNLRLLFDIKLAEDNTLHLSIIYKNLDQFDGQIVNFNNKDKGDRTPLHIACIYGTRYSSTINEAPYSIISQKVKKETKRFIKIVDKCVDSNYSLEEDKLFNWNDIEYALKCWCLYPLEAILRSNHNQNCENLINIFSNVDKNLLAYYASCLGYKNLLSNLIADNGLLLNELKYNREQNTLLHFACENGHNEIAELLIQNSANVNSTNEDGHTPLHHASLQGYNETALLLIENGANVNSINKNGVTPLHWACGKGHKETAELLIQHNAKVNSFTNRGVTPLQWACGKGHKQTAELLINNGANVNSANKNGVTPLQWACGKGHSETAQLLIQNNADVNSANKNGVTPLHWACGKGHKETAELLIHHDADIDSINNNVDTPLHLACENGHNETAKLLIQNNANVHSINKNGLTPLHLACEKGHNETAKLLIENNANINYINKNGVTPLHWACGNGNKETAELLIKNNADVNSVNKNGVTPLHWACGKGYKKIAELLIQNNANVNSINKKGVTPLHFACENGHNETAILLIQNNADVNIINEDGVTPLLLAYKFCNEDVVALMESRNENR